MSYLKERLRLFQIKSFRYFILSSFFATFGGGLSYIIVTWLVMGQGHEMRNVAIVMICYWLPVVVLGPFAGVLADRYNRKALMLMTNFIRGIILVGFALMIQSKISATSIYWLCLALGVGIGLYIPVVMTFVREIVPENQLLNANATLDMVYELGSILGMGGPVL
ncbi:MFS transporter [Piscirickettsia litoralis]|uniref:MFS transporter n=1 Tax=Piscirickettsia litoralis TaxID=1891921 RepID=UPI000981330E|nr:MFS transporter [Piscirickettsia litoralis]